MNRSNQNVFDVLRLIAQKVEPIGPTEISNDLHLPLTTVYRAFSTLEVAGYIERHQLSAKYQLSHIGHQLAKTFLSSLTCVNLVHPYLQQLSYATGETASLYVPIESKLIRAASVQGTQEPTAYRPVGEEVGRFSNTASHLIEIHHPGTTEEEYLSHILDPDLKDGLKKVYKQVKAAGIFTSPGEDIENAGETSFLIRLNKSVCGAITVEGPILMSSLKTKKEMIDQCLGVISKAEAQIASQMESNPAPYDLFINFRR